MFRNPGGYCWMGVLLMCSWTFGRISGESIVEWPSRDEILQKKCTFAQGLHPNLIRFVTKEGFHREIEDVVEVTFTNSPLSPGEFKDNECKFALLLKFTKDMFVDPYELKNIPYLKDYSKILNNWTDLESPAWSPKSNSTLFLQLQSNPTGNLVTTNQVKVPIHFRYQKPLSHSRLKERLNTGHIGSPGALVNPAGYVKVMVPLPRLLLRCEAWTHPLSEENCHVVKTLCSSKSSKDELCEWISLPYKSNSRQGNVVFIPVGDVDSTLLVSAITMLVVMGGTTFLLHTLMHTHEKLVAVESSSNQPLKNHRD